MLVIKQNGIVIVNNIDTTVENIFFSTFQFSRKASSEALLAKEQDCRNNDDYWLTCKLKR